MRDAIGRVIGSKRQTSICHRQKEHPKIHRIQGAVDAYIPSMRARALDARQNRRSDFEANCGGQKPEVRLRRPYQKCRTSICGGPSCTISPTCHSSAELQLYCCSASDPSRWPRTCMVCHPIHHYISVQAALQLKQFAVAKLSRGGGTHL